MEIIFERTSLYDEVWSEPMTKLAKKYGLSDSGLRLICQALNIPLPRQGHWAKLAAGHLVPRIALPENASQTTYVCRRKDLGTTDEFCEDKAWCKEREQFELDPLNRITVVDSPKKWNPDILALRERHLEAEKEYESYKKHALRWKKNPDLAWKDGSYKQKWRWDDYNRRGQILIDSHKAIPVKVTPVTLKRAMGILNAIAIEGETRGFSTTVNAKVGRIQMVGHDATIKIRLVERIGLQEQEHKPSGGDTASQSLISSPTGKLRLIIEAWRSSPAEFCDKEELKLEDQLNAVFIKIFRAVLREREENRRHNEWLRQSELEDQKRRAEEERMLLEKRRVEAEELRKMALEDEASRWQRATVIRQYVAHILKGCNQAEATELADWSNWASQVSRELDPTLKRISGTTNSNRH